MKTATPRTDDRVAQFDGGEDNAYFMADLARTLERETVAQAATIAQLREALETCMTEHLTMVPRLSGRFQANAQACVDKARAALVTHE